MGVDIGCFIRCILEDKINPCEEGEKHDLASLLFSDNQVVDYVCYQRSAKMGGVFSVDEASKFLGVSNDYIRRLAKIGILPSQHKKVRGHELLISKVDLEQFKLTYVLPGEAATRLGNTSYKATSLFIAKGIYPVSGPKVDGGRYYVFRRTDLDALGLMK